MSKTIRCLLATLPLLTQTARADEVRVADGRVLVGATRTVGRDLEVATLDGPVRVPQTQVVGVRTDAELRLDLQRRAARHASPLAALELARVARAYGLHDEMWAQLDRAWGAAGTPERRARVRAFMAGLEREVLAPVWREARPEVKVRALLRGCRGKVPASRREAVATLLAALPEATPHLRDEARRGSGPERRILALQALAQRGDPAVYRAAVLDRAEAVRAAAARLTREAGRTGQALAALAGALDHDHTTVRTRTVEALGALGDARALPVLVAAAPSALRKRRALPAGATRAHMAVLRQVSYIRDFDVEIASSSFIADPKVDVLLSGAVHDVTVLSVRSRAVEVRAWRDAIRRLAGTDPGPSPSAWQAWLDQRTAAARDQTFRAEPR